MYLVSNFLSHVSAKQLVEKRVSTNYSLYIYLSILNDSDSLQLHNRVLYMPTTNS